MGVLSLKSYVREVWEVIKAWDVIGDILYIFLLKFVLNVFWGPLIHIFLKDIDGVFA